VVSQIVDRFREVFWRIYGATAESAFRKYHGVQSHREGNDLYLVDRATGRPIPEFDTRRKEPP